MDMPKPSEEHRRLEKLAGDWKGIETMHPSPWDPKGGEANGATRARVALGGFAVIVDYAQERDGKTTFEGHGVYTWDGESREVVLHWFDSMGQAPEEFRGAWDGDRLELASRNPMGHSRMHYDLSQPGRMSSAMDMSGDGETWKRLFDASYMLQG